MTKANVSSWTESTGLTHMIVILQIWLFTFIIKLNNHVLFTWANYLTFWQLYSSSNWFKVWQLNSLNLVSTDQRIWLIKAAWHKMLGGVGLPPFTGTNCNCWEDRLQDRSTGPCPKWLWSLPTVISKPLLPLCRHSSGLSLSAQLPDTETSTAAASTLNRNSGASRTQTHQHRGSPLKWLPHWSVMVNSL